MRGGSHEPVEGQGSCELPEAGERRGRNPSPVQVLDASIADFNLQNCEMIKFCHFKPPCLWYLVTAALAPQLTE